jgi:hypothetical protein
MSYQSNSTSQSVRGQRLHNPSNEQNPIPLNDRVVLLYIFGPYLDEVMNVHMFIFKYRQLVESVNRIIVLNSSAILKEFLDMVNEGLIVESTDGGENFYVPEDVRKLLLRYPA